MIKKILLFTFFLVSGTVFSQTKNSLIIDCSITGMNIDTLSTASKIQEKLIYEYGETKDGYKYSKTEFRVNGVELKGYGTSVISKSDSYVLLSSAKSTGIGYGKKVYMFTNFYDLEAKEVMRQVTAFPEGVTEKVTGKCSIK